MVRKTKKHHTGKKTKGIYSIPELRRSFEHIESYINNKIILKESKEQIIKDLRKEWTKVFFKDLDKKSAEAFVSEKLSKKHVYRHKTAKRRGGANPISGSPLDYTTRQGIYLAPESIPKDGHLPFSDGTKSNYGSYIPYVDKGFSIPEPGSLFDPVPGQPSWPQVPQGMGSNAVHFGSKGGKRRKTRRGGGLGTILSQAFSHPIPASAPPGRLQDIQDMWYGKNVGPSSDQVERTPNYILGAHYPKVIAF